MAWYKFMQVKGGEEAWQLILAEQEKKIVLEKKPAFTTILACDNDFKSEMTSEDMANVSYKGDFYTDFDASSLEEATHQFQKFLGKLKNEHDVDLEQLYLYASGGKGYHCIIPMECFVEKPKAAGYKYLPAIYKELAMELYVDTLDLRVYTSRRGRQLRTENVERPDREGVFKVALTVEEVFTMTTEKYRDLCSRPRSIEARAKPTFNVNLALVFASAFDKVDKASKSKKKSKVDGELLKKFGGDFPPSIKGLMRGENIVQGIGFQKIATQLAIAAHTLGKTEEAFLDACTGLCESHASDGTRYNTVAKRKQELRRMYIYMKENLCYEFSIGGVKSLMTIGTNTDDLDAGGQDVGEAMDVDEDDDIQSYGIRLTKKGIWKKTDEGLVRVSALGLSDPELLIDNVTQENIGYRVTCHLNGQNLGQRLITMDTFLSRQQFMKFTLATAGSNISATDSQIGAMADVMRSGAAKSGNIVFTTLREGLDVVVRQDGGVDIIWIDSEGMVSNSETQYTLRTAWTKNARGDYNTDIRHAKQLEDTELNREFFRQLFKCNKPNSIAKLFGFYAACYLCQPIRHEYKQFPYMQIKGRSGSGKSASVGLFSHMHYMNAPPKTLAAGLQRAFGLEVAFTSSASLPLIIEEFKPSEMKADQYHDLLKLIRNNYQGTQQIDKGRVSSETGQSKLELRGPVNASPFLTLGETGEDQTAILQRAVVVALDPDHRVGCGEAFDFCDKNRLILSSFGRSAIDLAINCDFPELRSQIDACKVRVIEALGSMPQGSERPVFNLAVVMFGLEFARVVLEKAFGEEFNSVIEGLKNSLIETTSQIIPRTLPEVVKMLNVLAELSTITDETNHNRLVLGTDYIFDNGELHLAIHPCYDKFVRHQHATKQVNYYPSFEAAHEALRNHPAVKSKNPNYSVLKTTPTKKVISFDVDKLSAAGVDVFQDSHD